MLFSSLIFIFLFLPLLLLFYFPINNRNYRNVVLLLFSLLFYVWGGWQYFLVIFFTILVSYITGILIDKFKDNKKIKNLVFIIGLLLIIGNLLYFKYTDFLIVNINNLFNFNLKLQNIVLPIGISFYTFQILSYIIDLYRDKITVQKNILILSLYVVLFPQLIAGPIVRYETVEDELNNRKENLNDFINGIKRFILGLSKKVIISNNVAIIADFVFDNINVYSTEFGSVMTWLGAIAYTLQIYFDFSGYSDMAIGLGKIFGFHFLENFNYPYIATSITDFWRRWHISLSSWFRDYIYIPLGGNRVKKLRWLFNLLVVWTLTGLWHGASWNFVIWGLYYALLFIIEKLFLNKILEKLPKFIRWGYTIIIVIIGWVIFRVNNISDLLIFVKKMFDFTNLNLIKLLAIKNFVQSIFYIILGIIFMFPITKKFNEKYQNNKFYNIFKNLIYLSLFVICIVFLASSSYNPFIYFRF